MIPGRRGEPPTGGRRGSVPGVLAVGFCAALLLASCSSGGNGGSSSSGTTTSGRQTPANTSGGSSSTPTSTATAGTTTCQPAQLAVAPGRGTGAAGTQTLTVTLTNTSSTTCTLEGYPGMQLLDANGGDITTTVVRGQFHFPVAVANQSPSPVSLAPQAAATFSLAYEDVPVGNETSCPISSQAEITPPNDTTHLVMSLRIGPCNNGTIHVSPVYAGS